MYDRITTTQIITAEALVKSNAETEGLIEALEETLERQAKADRRAADANLEAMGQQVATANAAAAKAEAALQANTSQVLEAGGGEISSPFLAAYKTQMEKDIRVLLDTNTREIADALTTQKKRVPGSAASLCNASGRTPKRDHRCERHAQEAHGPICWRTNTNWLPGISIGLHE